MPLSLKYDHVNEEKQPLRKMDSNLQILENLLQTRKSLEVKKVNAIIEASEDQDDQELERLKYGMIRSSLEF